MNQYEHNNKEARRSIGRVVHMYYVLLSYYRIYGR